MLLGGVGCSQSYGVSNATEVEIDECSLVGGLSKTAATRLPRCERRVIKRT